MLHPLASEAAGSGGRLAAASLAAASGSCTGAEPLGLSMSTERIPVMMPAWKRQQCQGLDSAQLWCIHLHHQVLAQVGGLMQLLQLLLQLLKLESPVTDTRSFRIWAFLVHELNEWDLVMESA